MSGAGAMAPPPPRSKLPAAPDSTLTDEDIQQAVPSLIALHLAHAPCTDNACAVLRSGSSPTPYPLIPTPLTSTWKICSMALTFSMALAWQKRQTTTADTKLSPQSRVVAA